VPNDPVWQIPPGVMTHGQPTKGENHRIGLGKLCRRIAARKDIYIKAGCVQACKGAQAEMFYL